MDKDTYNRFRQIILRESGIALGPEKADLLVNRISKRCRALGISAPGDYLQIIETDADQAELLQLLDAISTNVTYFYREAAHFDYLARLCEQWRAASKRQVRIWCAASSSGEEPYTIAMCAAEHLDLKRTELKILATDISGKVLRQALAGHYEPRQLRDLPPAWKAKYFTFVSNSSGGERAMIDPRLQKHVVFKRLNLIHHPLPLSGPLDVIFCRNVMIYFESDLRRALVREFARLLAPGGHLLVGHSESLIGMESGLEMTQSAVYRKN